MSKELKIRLSFITVVAIATLVVFTLAWQVARTHELGKQNRILIDRTAALSRQNTDAIRQLQALQQQAIKACVGRHKIVLALTQVAIVNARRSKGTPSVIRNWQRLGIGIRQADCNFEQLRRSQELIGGSTTIKKPVTKVQLVIRYLYRTRTRTIRVLVPVNRTVRVPGPAIVQIKTVTSPTTTVTTPGLITTVTVTVPETPPSPPNPPKTTTTMTTTTVPKPCKPKPCKP